MKMKVWVLTKEVNAYDQYGEYFVAAFTGIPHHTQLSELGVPYNRLRHTQKGGGRVGHEDEWHHLREVLADAPEDRGGTPAVERRGAPGAGLGG